MLVDVGGAYKDLVEDRHFVEVMQDKISYEFADIIRQKLSDSDGRFADLQEDYEYLEKNNSGFYETLQEIRSLVQNAICTVEKMPRMDRKKIIQLLEEIENEADNAL